MTTSKNPDTTLPTSHDLAYVRLASAIVGLPEEIILAQLMAALNAQRRHR